jgi:hypothetical protein
MVPFEQITPETRVLGCGRCGSVHTIVWEYLDIG